MFKFRVKYSDRAESEPIPSESEYFVPPHRRWSGPGLSASEVTFKFLELSGHSCRLSVHSSSNVKLQTRSLPPLALTTTSTT